MNKKEEVPNNSIEGINFKALTLVGVVVAVIGGILEIINIILSSNLDISLRYSLSLLVVFFFGFIFLHIQNRILNSTVQELKMNYENLLKSIENSEN